MADTSSIFYQLGQAVSQKITSTTPTGALTESNLGYVESGKNYPVESSNGKLYVNVPWTDTDTQRAITSSLTSTSTSTSLSASAGKSLKDSLNLVEDNSITGVSVSNDTFTFTKGDGSTFTRSIADANTTYSTATASVLGLVKIGYSENGKNYPVELSNGQMFVNVPWTDTDTDTIFNGGTVTSDITVQNTGPKLILKDTNGGDGTTQTGYISYRDNGNTERGWVGFGSGLNKHLGLVNSIGDIQLRPDSVDGKVDLGSRPIVIGAGIEIKESSDRADLLEIKGVTSNWAGIQIKNNTTEHLFSLMSDGSVFGLYDDQQNEWAWKYNENAGHQFYYNASVKLTTTLTGISVTGVASATSFANANAEIGTEGQGRFGGWTSATLNYDGPAMEVGVSSGDGWMLSYDRSTSTYTPYMNFACGSARMKFDRDNKQISTQGLLQFGPADQTYQTLSVSPGPAASGATSYISSFNSNNMGFRTNGTSLAMEITHSGQYVKTPKQPFFHGKTVSHTDAPGIIKFENVLQYTGNDYSLASGRYTAPVTGRYLVTFNTLAFYFSTSEPANVWLHKNGSTFAFLATYTDMVGDYAGFGGSVVVKMSVGDYIYPYFNRYGDVKLYTNYTNMSVAFIG